MQSLSLLRLVLLIVVALSSISRAVAQVDDLTGYWLGTLGDKDEDGLRLLFRVYLDAASSAIAPRVALYSLDQGSSRLPANQVDYAVDHVAFYFENIGGRFAGDLDESKQVIAGVWHQGGLSNPLTIRRFGSDNKDESVPREFHFLLDKVVTGDTAKLQKMAGYWSGYLDDSYDEPVPEPPELVILEVEKINDELVEPKVFLPDEQAFPVGLRSLVVTHQEVKVVLDDLMGENNAIFRGKWEGDTISGVVQYDDDDYTPPLVLTWSASRPNKDTAMSRTESTT